MLASELIDRSLRLINIPGRGASLAPEDQTAALQALQEILDSEAVSKQFVPGIRRHFFVVTTGKSIYSYGANSALDLRSDDFDDDPAPIKIEDAYIREGSSITNNEKVDEYRFENLGIWILGGVGAIGNNELTLDGVGTAVQTLPLVAGRTYTIRVTLTVNAGDVELRLDDNAVPQLTQTLDSTGRFQFDVLFPGAGAATLDLETDAAGDDVQIDTISVIERNLDRLELPDAQGSDYYIQLIDQKRYNRRYSKGTGGRPYEMLYTRGRAGTPGYGRGEIRLDNAAIQGDIMVLDVLVNRVSVDRIQDEIRLNESAIRWLRYSLADNVAGEYGKSLNPRQLVIMDQAWNKLATGNRRMNMLGVDRALRDRPTFDINRGDP
jgi:hypothetical protein